MTNLRYHHASKTSQTLLSSRKRFLPAAGLLIWLSSNLLTLRHFPYVHSDEAWLSGLSLAMLHEKSLLVTEPFFDLFPRQVHAMKLLFHGTQAALIRCFGYQLFTVRFLSLIAGSIALVLFYNQLRHDSEANSHAPLLLTALMASNIQFIYAAHLARQEILLFAVLTAVSLLYHTQRPGRFWQMSLLIGLSALFHPNAFLIAFMFGLLILKDYLTSQIKLRELLQYAGILIVSAISLVGFSLTLTPDFLQNYYRYGQTLSVDAAPGQRWQNLMAYFTQLFRQNGGSYWLPDIRIWMILGSLGIVIALFLLVVKPKCLHEPTRTGLSNSLCLFTGFFLGIFIIGRYNPTSILFAFYPLFLLFSHLIQLLWQSQKVVIRKTGLVFILLLVIFSVTTSIHTITRLTRQTSHAYDNYLASINRHLPDDSVVLGNLSSYFGLHDKPFFDIRNLGYAVDETGQRADPVTDADIVRYLKKNQINTVIWYSEYDFILKNPVWSVLYEVDQNSDEPSTLFSSLKQVLDQHGTSLYRFYSPVYGTRMIWAMGNHPWEVEIFRIELPDDEPISFAELDDE